MKGYLEFANDLKMKESSGNYRIENQFGFIGAYQFGKPRLYDLGLSVDGYKPKFRPLKQVITKEFFKDHPDYQDAIFYLHVQDYMLRIEKKLKHYIGMDLFGIQCTESGMVAVAHLIGFGGLKKFLKGQDQTDGLGTKASEYFSRFAGYDLSSEFIKVDGNKTQLA